MNCFFTLSIIVIIIIIVKNVLVVGGGHTASSQHNHLNFCVCFFFFFLFTCCRIYKFQCTSKLRVHYNTTTARTWLAIVTCVTSPLPTWNARRSPNQEVNCPVQSEDSRRRKSGGQLIRVRISAATQNPQVSTPRHLRATVSPFFHPGRTDRSGVFFPPARVQWR